MKSLVAALVALLVLGCREEPARTPPSDTTKADLALLTSLPLALAEGFRLDAPPHPAMQRLERDYRVTLVDGPEQLAPGGLLLAIQPQALTAERLVALDQWIRSGGRLLLLADPRLSWESSLSLGDRRRPPFEFPDTGLLDHWGLTLNGPEPDGPVERTLGGTNILAASPGTLSAEQGSPCTISEDRFVARCRLGEGRAVIVADADLVQVDVPGGLDGPTDANLDALAAELKALRD
ncbi:Gldg family protein [Sphingomonas arenae]|uniref:Gldg family protein n=1 Tax=Sphingomonas arenae TaxID=2812555 RepID=UPI0019680053|nr:hypothetical protein [Sphingomonas arenae]